MKKQKKTNRMLQHFREVALNHRAQAQLRGGCGCGEDDDDGHPPEPPKKTAAATGN